MIVYGNEDAPAAVGGGTPSKPSNAAAGSQLPHAWDSSSRQVSWFEVFQFVERWTSKSAVDLDLHLPIAGTPRWCDLPDDDARKLLAVLLGGVREALTNDIHQSAMADASHEIAGSTDWSTVARRVQNGRGGAYIPRKAS